MFFDSEHGITVADSRGEVKSTDATVASPDWSRLYAVRGNKLVTFDPATNLELASTNLSRQLNAQVASTAGTLVALTADSAQHDATNPAGRERTTIVVADPSGARPARDFDLAGNFEPEAFSADDAFLFVLEYLPANAPERYRVRRVELATGQVQPLLLRDKQLIPPGAEEEMRGEGRQAVLSPDRTRLYTLYLHQGDHQHTRDLLPGRRGADGRAVHAFVHVLSLNEGWAYCLDLPEPFGLHSAGAHALTISPDGKRLYIAEMTTKQIAIADTESLAVTKVTTMEDDQPAGEGTAMSTSPDGGALYLGSSNVLRRLDSATLRVDGAWAMPAAVRGLAVSPDGRQVLLGQAGSIARVDASTGRILDTFAAAGLLTLRSSTKR
ncbi:YncE family protein [Lentzea sp. NPDC051213]|uniref:YncE family protein n=1 Tax=Lentzea sp. NPDC051213 TaxID=3364126 RepID=UPI003793D4AD